MTGLAFDFDAAFRDLTSHGPMSWQRRLYRKWLAQGHVPAALDLPTGLGKTSVIALWLLARAAGAKLPRRLVYVVDRRAVVDQATTVAEDLRTALFGRPDLSTALGLDERGLAISTLRGQHVDNRRWLEDPAAPAIVVGTVDMIGSRLLFEGYGVSRRMRPYMAGLLGVDALVVLDEAHLVPPFERLLEAVATADELRPREEWRRNLVPEFKVLSLSATGRQRHGDVFTLEAEDEHDEVVHQRLHATKRLSVLELGEDEELPDRLADEAWRLADGGARAVRVLVYCDRRKDAQAVADAVKQKAKLPRGQNAAEVELFVGERRVKERQDLANWLHAHGMLAGSAVRAEKPVILVATSAGEVGVDLDADDLVCDVVAWERMVQRWGRVNRRGESEAEIVVFAEPEPKERAKAPENRSAKEQQIVARWEWQQAVRRLLLEELAPAGEERCLCGPAALRAVKVRAATEPALQAKLDAATTPEPLRPALTLPLVEAWAMTSLREHTGRPPVAPWLRGWVEEDEPTTTVVWRTWLPATQEDAERWFEAVRPHQMEGLEAPVKRVEPWLWKRLAALADVDLGRTWAARVAARGEITLVSQIDDLKGQLAGATLVVDARLQGLRDGVLDDKAGSDTVVETLDGGAGWPGVPYRVRRRDRETAESSDDAWIDEGTSLVLDRDAEGAPIQWLAVERRRDEANTENGRSTARRAQLLSDHQEWARTEARAIGAAVGVTGDLARTLEVAALLHDEGKRARVWQRAFRAPADGPYAKTRGPLNTHLLHGYRHEFGSLPYAQEHPEFHLLPPEFQDLGLHLIAAHHGQARPLISTEGCEDLPPSSLRGRAQEVAIRFARLQMQWGPWGLAWWEALLRAADQRASRANDAGDSRGAQEVA